MNSVSSHPGNEASVQLEECLGGRVNYSIFRSLEIFLMDIRVEKDLKKDLKNLIEEETPYFS